MTEQHVIMRGRFQVTCDKCGKVSRSPEYDGDDRSRVEQQHRAALAAQGWRVYVNRSRRNYCPHCGPSPGHRMALVEGEQKR